MELLSLYLITLRFDQVFMFIISCFQLAIGWHGKEAGHHDGQLAPETLAPNDVNIRKKSNH